MSEDPTKDLTTDEMLRLILGRLDKLEAQSTGTTRPLLDQLIKEMIETRETLTARGARIEESLAEAHKELRAIDRKFDILVAPHLTVVIGDASNLRFERLPWTPSWPLWLPPGMP